MLVPVDESVRVIDSALAEVGHPDYQLVVFPDADHGICPVGGQLPGSPFPQRAAGFFELVIAWLTRRLRPAGTVD